MKRKLFIGLISIFLLSLITVSGVSSYLVYDPPPAPPPDSDGDGLTNYQEINIYHTDPYDSDTDDDKLNDYKEIKIYHSNPFIKDTDNDGLTDWEDVNYGYSPTFAEATHMFVYGGKVYCGVAYLAWVSDYSNWNYFPYINNIIEIVSLFIMDVQLNGNLDLDPLDGSTSSSYDYVSALEQNGYYVFTNADFTRESFADGFVEAWKFAHEHDTRLFAVTYTHGMPFNIDIPGMGGCWMTRKSGIGVGSGTFVNIGLRLIGKSIPEFVYYAAPCFGMFTMANAIKTCLFIHAKKNICFGTYNSGTQSAVYKFRTYGIIGSNSVYDAYELSESQNIGFFGSTTYILPRI